MKIYEFRVQYEDGFEIAQIHATDVEAATSLAGVRVREDGALSVSLLGMIDTTPQEYLAGFSGYELR